MQSTEKEEIKLQESRLYEVLKSGCKPKSQFKIGIEFEKLPVNKSTHLAQTYSGENGIAEFLKKYKQTDKNWNYILENDNPLGLLKKTGSITLEPGCQFELSLEPKENVHQIRNALDLYNKETNELANDLNFEWVGLGVQPLSICDNIELIPKGRYEFMSKHSPLSGDKALVMMKESAGIQVALDYESEEDCIEKLRVAIGISPVVSAMFANSPIRGGKYTGYKSYRSFGWLHTDAIRCGLISPKLFDRSYDFSFEDYVQILLDLPMLYIQRGDQTIKVSGINFRQFMESGYEGYQATIDDWNLQMTLFFPDVRLKNFIEVRNCDCQRSPLLTALPAIWKGIIYNSDAMNAVCEVMKPYCWQELNDLRTKTPIKALQAEIEGVKVADIALEVLKISYDSLKKMNVCNLEGQDESIYLEPLMNLVKIGKTPADVILEHWSGDWNQDIDKLIEYSLIK